MSEEIILKKVSKKVVTPTTLRVQGSLSEVDIKEIEEDIKVGQERIDSKMKF